MDWLLHIRMEWLLRKMERKIEKFGFAAMYVGDHGPSKCWIYSLGFQKRYGSPEVIIFDLPRSIANGLIWEIANGLETGGWQPRDGEDWIRDGEIAGRWRSVDPSQLEAPEGWFGVGRLVRDRESHGADYEAIQLVLRSPEECFPWEDGYDPRLRRVQPALYQPARNYSGLVDLPEELEAIRIADEAGWSIVKVEGTGALGWAYTVGHSDRGGAELICTAPSAADAEALLYAACHEIASGKLKLEDGVIWADEDFEACWRRVDETQYLALNVFRLDKLRREALTGLRQAVEAFQLFLPDEHGRYPWGHGRKAEAWEPLLFEPFDPKTFARGPLARAARM